MSGSRSGLWNVENLSLMWYICDFVGREPVLPILLPLIYGCITIRASIHEGFAIFSYLYNFL